MSERKARDRLISAAREHLPSTMINLSTAALIWLFGALVYLPAASRITPEVLPLAVALILLTAFSIFVFKASGGLRVLLGAASDVLAYRYLRWRKETEIPAERLKVVVRCIVYVVAVLIIYALYSPFLAAIHPSLAGLSLIPIVLWVFLMLLRTITARS